MLFLREVPPDVVDGVVSGIYKVTGSVVREVSSVRISRKMGGDFA